MIDHRDESYYKALAEELDTHLENVCEENASLRYRAAASRAEAVSMSIQLRLKTIRLERIEQRLRQDAEGDDPTMTAIVKRGYAKDLLEYMGVEDEAEN